MTRWLLLVVTVASAPWLAGCASKAEAARAEPVHVTYEVRNYRPTPEGPVLQFTGHYEFSGTWTSWSEVATSTRDEYGDGPPASGPDVYKDGVLSWGDYDVDRVAEPGEPFNPGPLFNLEHGAVSDDEHLLADDTTSQDLRELRERVAARFGVAAETLRATRVEESGVCGRSDSGCSDGVLTEVTTAVVRSGDAVPLYVRQLDNGMLNSEMEVSSVTALL